MNDRGSGAAIQVDFLIFCDARCAFLPLQRLRLTEPLFRLTFILYRFRRSLAEKIREGLKKQ